MAVTQIALNDPVSTLVTKTNTISTNVGDAATLSTTATNLVAAINELENVLRTLQGDKKVKNGKISFVMPLRIGDVKIFNNISNKEIYECLQTLS